MSGRKLDQWATRPDSISVCPECSCAARCEHSHALLCGLMQRNQDGTGSGGLIDPRSPVVILPVCQPKHLCGGAVCCSWPLLGSGGQTRPSAGGFVCLCWGRHVATTPCQIGLMPAPAAAISAAGAGASVFVCVFGGSGGSKVPMRCEPYDDSRHPGGCLVLFSI